MIITRFDRERESRGSFWSRRFYSFQRLSKKGRKQTKETEKKKQKTEKSMSEKAG